MSDLSPALFSGLPRRLLLRLLRFYKRWISPSLPAACRYVPTCSEYAMEAVTEHGAARGSLLALKRILRCHPFGGHGHDPVPPRTRTLAAAGRPHYDLRPGVAQEGQAKP